MSGVVKKIVIVYQTSSSTELNTIDHVVLYSIVIDLISIAKDIQTHVERTYIISIYSAIRCPRACGQANIGTSKCKSRYLHIVRSDINRRCAYSRIDYSDRFISSNDRK